MLAFFFKLLFEAALFPITKGQQPRQRMQRLRVRACIGQHARQQLLCAHQFRQLPQLAQDERQLKLIARCRGIAGRSQPCRLLIQLGRLHLADALGVGEHSGDGDDV